MKEYRPFFPRAVERALQFLHICHHAESALRVRVVKGASLLYEDFRDTWFAARRQLQQCL
ncbi:hypothetical protein D3C80_1977070 [compost metagenome]